MGTLDRAVDFGWYKHRQFKRASIVFLRFQVPWEGATLTLIHTTLSPPFPENTRYCLTENCHCRNTDLWLTTHVEAAPGLYRVGHQQLEELCPGLPGRQADRASCRWWLHYCMWAMLLCRRRLPFGPIFQELHPEGIIIPSCFRTVPKPVSCSSKIPMDRTAFQPVFQ